MIAAVAVAGVTAALVEVALPGHGAVGRTAGPGAVRPITAGVAQVATRRRLSQLAEHDAAIGTYSHHPVVVPLPARPESISAPTSGACRPATRRSRSTSATGARPNIALYYSGWGEPFQLRSP